MLSKRTLLACVAPYFCTALIACVASQADDDSPITPVGVDNAAPPTASPPSPPLVPATPASASASPANDAGDAGSADARLDSSAPEPSSDASADATPAPTLDCSAPEMWTNASTTACAVSSATEFSGGTITVGRYYLTQWADGAKTCSSKSMRQGTMTIEEQNGRQYLRWVISTDGRPSAGMYLLTPGEAPTTISRKEVCRKLGILEPATLMSYSATSLEIHFVHANGQETWKRVPKELPTSPYPIDPVIKQ